MKQVLVDFPAHNAAIKQGEMTDKSLVSSTAHKIYLVLTGPVSTRNKQLAKARFALPPESDCY